MFGEGAFDIRYVLRTLRRSPAFTLAAVLTLALGIGANTTIFSVVSAVLLRPPAQVREPDRLVHVFTSDYSGPRYGASSYADYLDFREDAAGLSGLTAFAPTPLNFSTGGAASRVWGEEVSGDYFTVLGVAPALGRTFIPDAERTRQAEPVAVLSYALWQRAFGADSAVVGREVRVNGYPFTVIGVAPEHFFGSIRGVRADIWVPYVARGFLSPERTAGDGAADMQRGDRGMFVIGRLAPGAALATAQASFDAIARRLHDAYPDYWSDVHGKSRVVTLVPERNSRVLPQIRGAVIGFFGLLMTVVALMLLICCANVANLLLVRAAGRRREISVRLALGAGRARLVRQLLTETAVIAILGGAVGLLIAKWATGLLMAFQPPLPVPVELDISLDGGVLAFTALVAALTGFIAGAAPALGAARLDLVSALKGMTSDAGPRRRRPALRNVLVVSQVATCVILLTMAGLLLRSLRAAQNAELGFDPSGIANFSVELANQGYDETRGRAFYDELLRRVAVLPSVRTASLAESTPLGLDYSRRGVGVEGYEPGLGEDMEFGANIVGPGYLGLMHIPLERGRDFSASDRAGSLPVAIVNQSFARRFWPGEDPIGKRIRIGDSVREVVGIAHDSRTRSLDESPAPYFYLPFLQHYQPNMTLEVRTAGDPTAVIPVVRREIAALDHDLPVQSGTMEDALGLSLLPQRAGATLLGIFSVLGLVLASVGLYGVVAYAVAQRARDLGIRMALGAGSKDIYRVVLGHGVKLTSLGLIIGIVAALILARLAQGVLFGVSSTDPITLGSVAVILAAVAFLASFIPARRATRVDPMVAVREE
jgi:predicted permease